MSIINPVPEMKLNKQTKKVLGGVIHDVKAAVKQKKAMSLYQDILSSEPREIPKIVNGLSSKEKELLKGCMYRSKIIEASLKEGSSLKF